MLINDLVVFHRSGPENIRLSPNPLESVWFHWGTCLREVWVGWSGSSSALLSTELQSFERHDGADAYKLILEIICGLRSPLFGETEVFGQFKEASGQFSVDNDYWNSRFEKLFSKLLSDAKRVRQLHLTHFGSQSYGSVVRKEVRNYSHIHILGAGQLVREMLPWLSQKTPRHPVKVYGRDLDKMREDLKTFESVQLRSLAHASVPSDEAGVLIIAAPLGSVEVVRWLKQSELKPQLVIDLRGESAHDPLEIETAILDLNEVFSKISANRQKQSEFRLRAQSEIHSLAHKRWSEVEFRPFGWEDLCTL